MPELPEVETTRKGLEPAMADARFTEVRQRRANLRLPFPEKFEQRLLGAQVTSLDRRAKYLVARLSTNEGLIMHLGMSGSFSVFAPDQECRTPGTHDHVLFGFSNGFSVVYNDPRRFGFMDLVSLDNLETCRHFAGLGIEPLGNALSGQLLRELFKARKTNLKSALLDQRHIAGLGNIYVCEALFRTGLHPERAAGSLNRDESELLAANIRIVLQEALESGGSTLRNYSQTDGSLGYFQHRFQVYDRAGEACRSPGCTGKINRIVQGGRSTFFCPDCQKA